MNIQPIHPFSTCLSLRVGELLWPNPANSMRKAGHVPDLSRGPDPSQGRHKDTDNHSQETHTGAPPPVTQLNLSYGNSSSVVTAPSFLHHHTHILISVLFLLNCCNLVSFTSLHPHSYLRLATVMQE